MSKSNHEDQADLTPAAGETPAEGGIKSGDPAVLTVEEHAERLKIDRPVFAAVMQTERWASGKKVPEAVFKKAVEGFLNAPMGGTNVTRY
jgi:2-keto-4-pentenoate hydratase